MNKRETGRELCKRLAKSGAKIVCLDGFSENGEPVLVLRHALSASTSELPGWPGWGVLPDCSLNDGLDWWVHWSEIYCYKDGDRTSVETLEKFLEWKMFNGISEERKKEIVEEAFLMLAVDREIEDREYESGE
jgi:hypothetical protein